MYIYVCIYIYVYICITNSHMALWLSGSLALWLSGEVAYTWSLAVWERALPVEWLSSTFIHALHTQHQGTLSWQSITNPAGAFVKTMVGAGWFFPEEVGP